MSDVIYTPGQAEQPRRPIKVSNQDVWTRQTPVIVVACFIAFFAFIFSSIFSMAGLVVIYAIPGLEDGGAIVSWWVFCFVHALLFTTVAGMFLSRGKHIAVNIVIVGGLLGYMMAHAILKFSETINPLGV